MLSKNVTNKKCAPKFVFFHENKFRKFFDLKNWLWKSNFCTFWHLPFTPISKIQWFHLTTVAKNLCNFVSLPWKLHNQYCHSTHLQNNRLAAAVEVFGSPVGKFSIIISSSSDVAWSDDSSSVPKSCLKNKEINWESKSFLRTWTCVFLNYVKSKKSNIKS